MGVVEVKISASCHREQFKPTSPAASFLLAEMSALRVLRIGDR
jgi:hypothetical protein